jgi:prepilin-type N-terminal cleavage/methylation domain-containing protein
MRARLKNREAGFSLIETLIALIIFVGCYLLLHQSVALGWRGLQVAHSETVALEIGQSLLAETGIDGRFSEGQQSGTTEDGYTWTITVSRYEPGGDKPEDQIVAYRVGVDVSWKEVFLNRPRTLALTTIKLGRRT